MKCKLLQAFIFAICLTVLVLGSAQASAVTLPTTGVAQSATVTELSSVFFRLDILNAPQLLTLKIETKKANRNWLFGRLIDRIPTDDDPTCTYYASVMLKTSGSNAIYKRTMCLQKGTYYLEMYREADEDDGPSSIDFKVSASAKALSGSHGYEVEPNNGMLEALPLSLNQVQAGLVANSDVDYYKFQVGADAKVKITLKQYRGKLGFGLMKMHDGKGDADIMRWLDWDGEDEDEDVCPFDDLFEYWPGKAISKPITRTVNLSLPQGTYYTCVYTGGKGDGVGDVYSFYDLKVATTGDAVTSLTMPKSYKLPLGTPTTIKAGIAPTYFNVMPVTYTSSAPEVASVDSATGLITPVKVGKTTITAATLDGKKRASTTLNVLESSANRFSRAKPLRGKTRDVWTSTKALYYEGETLIADVFVYNGTKRKINLNYLYGVEDALVELVDMDADNNNARDPVDVSDYAMLKTQPLPSGIPSRVVKPGKYALVKVQITGVPGLILVNGRYNVVLNDDIDDMVNGFLRFGKGLRGGLRIGGALPTMKNIQADPAAQPEYGVQP